jgi:NitT/TauT family transport system substrate-binding protein
MSTCCISRRTFTTAAFLAAASVAVPLARGQSSRPEKARLSIVVGAQSSFAALPLTIASQLGYFRAEGLDVDVVQPSTGGRQLQDGPVGPVDVYCGPFEQVVQLQGRGQAFQAFVLQARAPQVAIGVSMRALPGYRGVADLRGRRIGVSSIGMTTSMVARLVLSRGGVDPAEVSFVGVGANGDALSSFHGGQVEAISHTDPVITQLEQRGDLRIIGDTRTLKGTQELFGGPMPSDCLYASQEFVQKHPIACQALANAVVHALKWLQTAGPSDIIRTVPEAYFQGDRALYLAAFAKVREAISPDGLMPDDGVRTAIRTLARFDPGVRPEKVDATRSFTNEFARRAKDKFRA